MNNNNYNLLRPLAVLIIIFLLTALLDRVVQEGMFFDGVTYAAISRNLAMGKGSFWDVYYRGDWRFSEHPPLMFGIQALFFKVLGDSYLTERVYCLVLWLATIFSMRLLWNKMDPSKDWKYSFALTLLAWGIIPTVMWAYPNNLLDTTMALFDLLAVFFIYNALQSKTKVYMQLAFAGFCIFLATLTKGPVGVFPLAVPAIHWLVFRGYSLGKAVLYSIIPLVVLIASYAIIYTYPPAKECLDQYLQQQLFMALAGKREVVESSLGRFQLLVELFFELMPSLILAAVILILAKVFKRQPIQINQHKKHVLFYLLIAFSASLPIMLSLKQRSFYLVPAFPFYAIAIALVAAPYYVRLAGSVVIPQVAARYTNIGLTVACIGAAVYIGSKFGNVAREHDLISNIKTLQQHLPEGERVGITRFMDNEYTLLAYLERYHKMEVNLHYNRARYVLINEQTTKENFLSCLSKLGYDKTDIPLKGYTLYKKTRPSITQLMN